MASKDPNHLTRYCHRLDEMSRPFMNFRTAYYLNFSVPRRRYTYSSHFHISAIGWLVINKDLINLIVCALPSHKQSPTLSPATTLHFLSSLSRKSSHIQYPTLASQTCTARSYPIPGHMFLALFCHPPVATTLPSAPPRSRQRYLYDFIPNHPG